MLSFLNSIGEKNQWGANSSSLSVGNAAGGLGAERAKQPAPPLQGGHLDLPEFPGLAPWAFLPDPFGVLFGSLT